MDIAATVEATARSGGYFQPVYRNRREPPEHVMLVRSLDRHDQHAGLVEELAGRFKSLGLNVHVYRFRDNPRLLIRWDEETGDSCRLEQVLARYGNARLMVFSETDILFHPYSGEVRPWLTDLKPWQHKVWLHPFDAHANHARLLADREFLMLPLTRDSLPQLVSHLTMGHTPKLREQPVDPEPLPEMIAENPDAWLDEHPPQGVDLVELFKQLKHYLGNEGLLLLRTIAVYPKPGWELTKALDFLLCGHAGDTDTAGQREQRFFRLSRLPWLTHGFLPNWLREVLLQHSSPDEKQRVVTVWQSLFSQLTSEDQPGALQLDFSTPSKRQFKLRFDEQRMMRQSDALNDPIFAHILLDGKLGLLDFHMPRFLNKLMPGANQWIILRPALVLWFCVAILGSWGITQYGVQAYTTIQQQRNELHFAQWHITLQYQSDTQALVDLLQQRLLQDQFRVMQPAEISDAALKTNTIIYPAGGEKAAARIKLRMKGLAYGAEVVLRESPELEPHAIQAHWVNSYGAAFNDELRMPAEPRLPFEPEMVRIPPGKFLMGSPDNEAGRWSVESPQREVTIAYAFEMSKYEITFDEYDAFAKATNRKLP
ncbi:MAG: SUMF1/EgtB/PvdO family nonheme iron enzyme, partial [Burkholderiales bacterium]|nr:SUMF1/EgtB/PvdO family nonheme iron enzyme [Burkholderiales bacterium]